MSDKYDTRMRRVVQYIHDNPGGDLSLDRLADVAAMSRFHWHRVFRATTGETVAQVVRRVRLTHAANRLLTGDAPIAEIAAQVGYPNPSSFARAFRAFYGLTPESYRRAGGGRPLTHANLTGVYSMHKITITDRPALRLAALRHTGPYHQIDATFGRLYAHLKRADALTSAGLMVGVYYDCADETPQSELRSHAGVILPDGVTLPDGLDEVLLPAGPHAVLAHHGAYDSLPAAYDQLYCDWLPGSGRTPADFPPFEIYLNDPANTAPQDLRTDICLPLE